MLKLGLVDAPGSAAANRAGLIRDHVGERQRLADPSPESQCARAAAVEVVPLQEDAAAEGRAGAPGCAAPAGGSAGPGGDGVAVHVERAGETQDAALLHEDRPAQAGTPTSAVVETAGGRAAAEPRAAACHVAVACPSAEATVAPGVTASAASAEPPGPSREPRAASTAEPACAPVAARAVSAADPAATAAGLSRGGSSASATARASVGDCAVAGSSGAGAGDDPCLTGHSAGTAVAADPAATAGGVVQDTPAVAPEPPAAAESAGETAAAGAADRLVRRERDIAQRDSCDVRHKDRAAEPGAAPGPATAIRPVAAGRPGVPDRQVRHRHASHHEEAAELVVAVEGVVPAVDEHARLHGGQVGEQGDVVLERDRVAGIGAQDRAAQLGVVAYVDGPRRAQEVAVSSEAHSADRPASAISHRRRWTLPP